MTHVITRGCCNDATCVSVCPVNCIHPTPDEPGYGTAEMLYIDPEVCIDCGACVDPCPVDAIVPDYDLPEEDSRFAEINALYFADPEHRGYAETRQERRRPRCEVAEGAGPLRVAIVGTGPAACYAAEELLAARGCDARVTLFDRLPTPWGLVRFGVAPDHPDTKAIATLFAKTASRERTAMHLNVEIGEHITHHELLDHHHAVIYAVGAGSDRKLGIPGEELAGSHSAAEFVAWYNGHPEFAGSDFDLSGERAVIVGNGNVALDVARVLTAPVDELRGTDIAEHALDALATSNVTEVVVLGRRGPSQAAFTTPELLDLGRLSDVDVRVEPECVLGAGNEGSGPLSDFKAKLLAELAAKPAGTARARIVLRFLSSPLEVLGDEQTRGLRVARNELVRSGAELVARATGETEDLDCGLVLRSIGYRGSPIPGLPFDDERGTLPTMDGRVLDRDGTVLNGVYAAGWIKRGPSGGIGTNRACAADTVRTVLDDYANDRLTLAAADPDAFDRLLRDRRPETLSYADWKVLDAHERSSGAGRPRTKMVDLADMLDVLRSASSTT